MMIHPVKAKQVFCLVLVVLIGFFWNAERVKAQNLGKILRRMGNVADDVPIRQMDEVIQNEKACRAALRKVLGVTDDVPRPALVRQAWKNLLEGTDPSLLRHVDELPQSAREAGLVMAHGAKQLTTTIPDMALRSRFIRDGGATTLITLGRYDDLADDAFRFDRALREGKLLPPPGHKALTLQDFGNFFHQLGDRGYHFWNKYVRPHWRLWLGSAALGYVLLAPEEHLNAVGEVTQKGLEKIGEVGGKLLADVLGGLVAGTVKGAGGAVEGTATHIFRAIFSSPWTLVSTILLLGVMLVLYPRTRRWLFGWRRKSSTSGQQEHPQSDS